MRRRRGGKRQRRPFAVVSIASRILHLSRKPLTVAAALPAVKTTEQMRLSQECGQAATRSAVESRGRIPGAAAAFHRRSTLQLLDEFADAPARVRRLFQLRDVPAIGDQLDLRAGDVLAEILRTGGRQQPVL